MQKPHRIIYFTKYTRNAGSSRLRSFQYFPFLEDAGFQVEVSALFGEKYLEQLYAGQSTKREALSGYLKRFLRMFSVKNYDTVVVEKELFPFLPAFVEQIFKLLGVKYIVDYDDAVFHNYDLHCNSAVKSLLGKKIDTVMKNASVVVAGNSYLADRAKKAGAKNIEIIPTVIDLARYPLSTISETRDGERKFSPPDVSLDRAEETDAERKVSPPNVNLSSVKMFAKKCEELDSTGKFVIGWIGTKSTFEKHLLPQKSWILKAQEIEGVEFHVVGITTPQHLGDHVKYIPWAEDSEVSEIQKFDVGIMPLEDSPWEKGKCSYKIIQYFACEIPAIVSPIGMNKEVVIPGENGFWATTEEEWLTAIKTLRQEKELRNSMGLQGRKAVENKFAIQVTAKKWIGILNELR
jgi:glycosyltransferase involved in cell wall biosynthesis